MKLTYDQATVMNPTQVPYTKFKRTTIIFLACRTLFIGDTLLTYRLCLTQYYCIGTLTTTDKVVEES